MSDDDLRQMAAHAWAAAKLTDSYVPILHAMRMVAEAFAPDPRQGELPL
jgi:hypothetical protein